MVSEPNVVTMNVSLPQPLKRYVDGRVSSGIYGSASEFVREAIREKLSRDQEQEQARAILAQKLQAGLNSGEPIEFTRAFSKRKRRELIERFGKKKKVS
jgi:antitoxin ParD1/3/4